ncbi:N-acetylmuramoyl-L-alanine amidase [Fodinisporobacter ferrooxydans]|uniref:N-acetylmuramoyl-L-alanine amidase n=1 Tax=Fodinisporobacter ferrooxydans TaxID=2901836 RepID=A0ABY4CET7_9BACL|nr:N-acetylmuramoyl-L-alanine amidase [Alicyclobacillaceae bacterium MYW30-H2]
MQKNRWLPVAVTIVLTLELFMGKPFAHAANQPDQQNQNEVVVNAYDVHIRSGAGTDYPIVGQTSYGAHYSVISQDQGWFEVRLPNGGSGWIAGWLTTSTLSTGQGNVTQTASALEKDTHVRSGPSTTYPIVATIDPGTAYLVSQISGDWIQIRLPNERSGWVAKWVVKLSDQSSQQAAHSELSQGTITASDVNLHDSASLQGKVLAHLQPGTIVQVIEQQKDWTKIQVDKQTGWVASNYVQTANQTTPLLPGPIAIASGQSTAGTVQPMGSGINIRMGPSQNDAILGIADPQTAYPVVGQSGKWWNIQLQSGKTAWIASWVVQANQVQNSKAQSGSAKPFADQSLRGKTIVIDPGHGGIDVGAIGTTTGLYEKDMALATAKILYNKLQATGAHVIMTRTNDTYVSLKQRVDDSIAAHADAFISIHENTNSNPDIAGTITYYYNAKGQDAKLAEDIEQSIDGGVAHPDLGTQFGDYYVLRQNPQLAVLVECAFLSNASDELLAESTDFQERIADGILKGVLKYFQDRQSGQSTTR